MAFQVRYVGFGEHSIHQPAGEMIPATILHALGGSNWTHLAQAWPFLGEVWPVPIQRPSTIHKLCAAVLEALVEAGEPAAGPPSPGRAVVLAYRSGTRPHLIQIKLTEIIFSPNRSTCRGASRFIGSPRPRRKSASVAGYNYSDAMENFIQAGTLETLDAYLANPSGVVPGTKMIFPGIKNRTERVNLIAYL
jgi:hypothetical protein